MLHFCRKFSSGITAACPTKGKAQQSGAQARDPEGIDGGSKGIDHRTKVKTNENIKDPRDVSQLCANK